MRSDEILGAISFEGTQRFFDGSTRKVYCTDIETPFPDGSLIVSSSGRDGVIKSCNEAFVFMSGYSREELLGQPHAILRHPDMPSAAFKELWVTVESGHAWKGIVKNLRKDGGFYWVYATVVPNIRSGKIIGYTSVRRQASRERIEETEGSFKEMSA